MADRHTTDLSSGFNWIMRSIEPLAQKTRFIVMGDPLL